MAIRRTTSSIWKSDLDNARLTLIDSYVSACSLRLDTAQDQPWTLTLDILDKDPPLDLDEFDLVAIDQHEQTWDPINGVQERTDQLGLFVLMPPTYSDTRQMGKRHFIGYDLLWYAAISGYPDGFTILDTDVITTVMGTVLTSTGLTRYHIQPSTRTPAATRSWPPATRKRQVINDLAGMLAYETPICDRLGVPTSGPIRLLRYEDAAWEIRSDLGMVQGAVSRATNINDLWNMVVATKNRLSEDPIVVTLTNDRADSPVSTVNLGFTKMEPVESSTAETEADLLLIAQAKLEEGASSKEVLDIFTTPLANFGMHDVVGLDVVRDDGTTVVGDAWWWKEMSLSIVPPGPQLWRMRRVLPWDVEAVVVP